MTRDGGGPVSSATIVTKAMIANLALPK